MHRNDCDTCERVRTRDAGTAPLWDNIVRTDARDIVHCYDTSLLGWIVMVSRRHVDAVDELSLEEARELGELLQRVSAFLKAELGCVKTYVMQFAEHPKHPHVHFHVVPRMASLPPQNVGANIFNYLGVDSNERVSDAGMDALAVRLREYLSR